MNGAEALVETLVQYDVEVMFGVSGDTSIGLYEALYAQKEQISHVMARDERSAAFMADVYARLTGKPGICEGPSGGGATYMLPGVVEAHRSSIALIALTTDNPVDYEAQGALTDLDQPQIYSAVTKWTTLVKKSDMLPRLARRAFRLATGGRPGAVHLALPKCVLSENLSAATRIYSERACKSWPSHRTRADADAVERAVRRMVTAERPVIVAGGGAVSSDAHEELSAVAHLWKAPVATTINGKGAIAESDPLSLGVVGANGGRPYAADIVREADLVLFVGSKVNYVDTDSWRLPPVETPPAIIQIDIDSAEIGNNYPVTEGLCGDAKAVLADLHAVLYERSQDSVDRHPWSTFVTELKAAWNSQRKAWLSSTETPIRPQRVFAEIQSILCEDSVLVCDPGTATPFAAAHLELPRAGREFICPRSQGGLGYTIPGVVGARLARPQAPILGLFGDGSFAMSAGDLATVARVGGPTVLILLNNSCYGWIKALQHLYCEGRYFSVDMCEPLDYVRIADGFGLPGLRVEQPGELRPAMETALNYGGPFFVEIITAPEHEVLPPVAPWKRVAALKLDE